MRMQMFCNFTSFMIGSHTQVSFSSRLPLCWYLVSTPIKSCLLTFHLFVFFFSCIGSISIDELRGVMKSLGQNPTDEELARMIQSVDDNGNNEIDFQEFLILMSSKKSMSDDPDRELRDAFAVFDSDGSGLISRSELKGLLNNLGQVLSDEELDAMMNVVDKDGNGEIDFEEFKAMMVRYFMLFAT